MPQPDTRRTPRASIARASAHTAVAGKRASARAGARTAACVAGAAATLLTAAASARAESPARTPAQPVPIAGARRAGARHKRRPRPPAPPRALLLLGSHGHAVAVVQRALHLHPSGRYGSATVRAVVRFQRLHHLLVDGIVGPQTWDALFHISRPPVDGAQLADGAASADGAYAPDGSPPADTAPPQASATSSATVSSPWSGGYAIPTAIVMCESGGNWRAVNPSSGAGGAYQIMPSTWVAYGGQGLPQDASPAQQSRIAAEIWATQGPSAWSC